MREALEYGQIEVLTWFEKNKAFDIDISTEMIIGSKNFETIQSFIERDWPMGFEDVAEISEFDIIATENMDIIKYFVDRGLQLSEESIDMAIECENFEILKYLISIGIELREDAFELGSMLERFEMMKLRFERDGVWNNDVNIYSCVLTEEKKFMLEC